MNLMIASDLHGSFSACKALLDAKAREGCDRLLLLGDVLYHGPRNDLPEGYNPKKVAETLNAVSDELLCVRGNCDAEIDQTVLAFPILSEACLLYVANRAIYATHGHHVSFENPPALREGDILLHGHTHVACKKWIGNIWYANPGSPSIPKNGTPKGYMTLTEESLSWHKLDGTVYERLNL